tara:strand:- start:140 stop:388 length:249 start_codon:yes stop_codon:yes gene_type:complete
MSLEPAEIQLVAMSLVGLFIFGMYRLYRWTKTRSPNAQVWGTIFESLSHYTQPQELLKEPKQEIHKQKRQSGDDKDKNEQHY